MQQNTTAVQPCVLEANKVKISNSESIVQPDLMIVEEPNNFEVAIGSGDSANASEEIKKGDQHTYLLSTHEPASYGPHVGPSFQAVIPEELSPQGMNIFFIKFYSKFPQGDKNI